MPFHTIRTKIMLPFLLWLLLLLFAAMVATVSIFHYQEERRVQALAGVPQVFFKVGFEFYLDQIKQVTGADVVVFDNTDGVIDTTLPDIPSPNIAASVRIAEARTHLFQQGEPYVSWNVECDGIPYRTVHYPLDRTGRIWTYLLNRTESIQAQRRLVGWLAGILVGGVLMGALLAHLVSRTVTRPVADLVEATRRVAEGEFDQRSPIQTQDEIGRLAESFNQMTEQLEASRQALIEAERFSTAGKMSATFAHEIRNPLSSIRMLLQVLRRRIPPESERYVQATLEEVERLNVIVDGLLDFARPSELRFGAIQVSELLDDVLQLMDANLRHHQIDLHRDYEPDQPIQADASKLKQAFMNLILNAMQAMPEGGKLTIILSQREEEIEIRFADTGVGMTQEQREQLFEPFFTTKERGTGLGLTHVQRIVEQHGGSIEVESKVGQGTAVVVRLR